MLEIRHEGTREVIFSISVHGSTAMNTDEIARLMLHLKHAPIAQNMIVKFRGQTAVRADMLFGGALPSVVSGAGNVHSLRVQWPPDEFTAKENDNGTL